MHAEDIDIEHCRNRRTILKNQIIHWVLTHHFSGYPRVHRPWNWSFWTTKQSTPSHLFNKQKQMISIVNIHCTVHVFSWSNKILFDRSLQSPHLWVCSRTLDNLRWKLVWVIDRYFSWSSRLWREVWIISADDVYIENCIHWFWRRFSSY